MNNIRLVTWRQNLDALIEDRICNKGSSAGCGKYVQKFNHSGDLICEYVSAASAQRDMGYSLERQIKLGVKCRNGFFWKYKENSK
jgi:hypothetical protein